MQPMRVQGVVATTLHGPRGEVNGAMLENGTVLRLPPPEAARFESFLKMGATVAVQGDGRTTPLGSVVAVRAIGPTPDQLNQVQAPPPPPHHGRRHGPPGPDSF
jgi:hypothetical protein